MEETSISTSRNIKVPPRPSAAPKGPKNAPAKNEKIPDYDRPFIKQLGKIILDNLRNIPSLIKNHYMWLVPLVILWFLLGTIPDLTRARLPSALNAVIGILIFLTATYSPWIAKALYAGFIGREVVGFIKEAKQKGFMQTLKDRTGRLTRTYGIAFKAFKAKGKTGYMMLLCFGGMGFMAANVLSRNNHIDKYLAVWLTAIGISLALSRGLNDPVIRLIRAFWRDVSGAARKEESSLTTAKIYIAVASFVIGLLGSIIFVFKQITNTYYDPTGYIVGGACLVAGIIWYFAGGRTNKSLS